VLLLRDLFKPLGDKKPRIISEILDPRTKDLLEQDYGADFVVSSEITSMLMAQISERRELNAVFGDLFDSAGNEIYLKRAACYVMLGRSTSWMSVQKVARARREVAIGYMRLGQTPLINPPQLESLVFGDEDRVIVLAENDSEAVVDSSRGELGTSPRPMPEVKAAAARSGLLPPEAPKSQSNPVAAGPRVTGLSTMPREPLPPKPRGQ